MHQRTPRDFRYLPSLVLFAIFVCFVVYSVPIAAQLAGRPTRPQVQPPQGAVRQVIFKNCVSCHGIDDYAFFALDKSGWKSLIDTNKDIALAVAKAAAPITDKALDRKAPRTVAKKTTAKKAS